jgi:hypothetical protein
VAKFVHWEILGNYKIERGDKWYEHQPEGVLESDEVNIYWDFTVQCDRYVKHRKPDIIVINKLEKKCFIIDIAIPGDSRVKKKEEEKIKKYQELKQEMMRLWRLKSILIIPVVVGALGAVSMNVSKWLEKLNIRTDIGLIQKTALLGTARILRRTLDA